MVDKVNWTREDQKFMRCICCDEITFHRFDGWWIHKRCEKELINFLATWDIAAYGIKMEIIDWKKAIELAINYDPKKLKEYNKELTSKAFELFTQRYGTPCWVKDDPRQEAG